MAREGGEGKKVDVRGRRLRFVRLLTADRDVHSNRETIRTGVRKARNRENQPCQNLYTPSSSSSSSPSLPLLLPTTRLLQ